MIFVDAAKYMLTREPCLCYSRIIDLGGDFADTAMSPELSGFELWGLASKGTQIHKLPMVTGFICGMA